MSSCQGPGGRATKSVVESVSPKRRDSLKKAWLTIDTEVSSILKRDGYMQLLPVSPRSTNSGSEPVSPRSSHCYSPHDSDARPSLRASLLLPSRRGSARTTSSASPASSFSRNSSSNHCKIPCSLSPTNPDDVICLDFDSEEMPICPNMCPRFDRSGGDLLETSVPLVALSNDDKGSWRSARLLSPTETESTRSSEELPVAHSSPRNTRVVRNTDNHLNSTSPVAHVQQHEDTDGRKPTLCHSRTASVGLLVLAVMLFSAALVVLQGDGEWPAGRKGEGGGHRSTCCQAKAAACLACLAGTSVDIYCARPETADVSGCTQDAGREKSVLGREPHEARRGSAHPTEPPRRRSHGRRPPSEQHTKGSSGRDGGHGRRGPKRSAGSRMQQDWMLRDGQAPQGPRRHRCCAMDTAECYACRANISVAEVCRMISDDGTLLAGCGKPHDQGGACCKEDVARCLACVEGHKVEEFCLPRERAKITGCSGFCGFQEADFNYPGGDFRVVPDVASAAACCDLCRVEPRCTSWSWAKLHGRSCHLKRQMRLRRELRSGFVSGQPGNDTMMFQLKDHRGMCLDAAGSLRIQDCGSPSFRSQWWSYSRRKGELRTSYGACVYSPELGRPGGVHRGPCEPAWASRWAYDSTTGLVHYRDGLCLQVPELQRAGLKVTVRPCSADSASQQWELWTTEKAPEPGSADPPNTAMPSHVATPTAALVGGASGVSIFCFSLMLPWGYGPLLVGMQFAMKTSIFACNEATVYTNMVLDLGGITTRVVDTDLHSEFGGEWYTAASTPIFQRLWEQVTHDGIFRRHDWTAKVEPDAVFIPGRLRKLVFPDRLIAQTGNGAVLNNCQFGLHGPLEVVSRTALETYADGWTSQCSGPDTAPQEGAYLQGCLLKLGVRELDRFDTLLAGPACKTPNWTACKSQHTTFYPFETVAAYTQCLETIEWQEAHPSTTMETLTSATTTVTSAGTQPAIGLTGPLTIPAVPSVPGPSGKATAAPDEPASPINRIEMHLASATAPRKIFTIVHGPRAPT